MDHWFLQGDYTPIPTDVPMMLMGLLLAFCCGHAIAWVYMFTHSGLSYSRSFVNSLVVIPHYRFNGNACTFKQSRHGIWIDGSFCNSSFSEYFEGYPRHILYPLGDSSWYGMWYTQVFYCYRWLCYDLLNNVLC